MSDYEAARTVTIGGASLVPGGDVPADVVEALEPRKVDQLVRQRVLRRKSNRPRSLLDVLHALGHRHVADPRRVLGKLSNGQIAMIAREAGVSLQPGMPRAEQVESILAALEPAAKPKGKASAGRKKAAPGGTS